MHNQHRKGTKNEGYRHPLIKNIGQVLEETHEAIVPSYQPLKANNSKRVSSKIVRCSYMPNSHHRQILVDIAPFSEAIQSLGDKEKVIECINCRGKLCPLSNIENHTDMHCSFCGKVNHISGTDKLIEQSWGYTYAPSISSRQKETKNRKVLFVIEASQRIYQANIQQAIFNCLHALEDPSIEVGFILFDNQAVFILNGVTHEVTKIKILDNDSWTDFPLSMDELFTHINGDLSELQEIIEQLLYEAFYLKQTILKAVNKILEAIPIQIEVKTFLTTLTDRFSQNENKNNIPNRSIFQDKQNKLASIVGKKISIAPKQDRQIVFRGNQQHYIFPYSTNAKQALQLFGFGVCKIYDLREANDIEKELYYDLFQAINQEVHKNIEVVIRTEKGINFDFQNNPIYTDYGNLEVKQQNKGDSNQYLINIKRATSSYTFQIHFKDDTKELMTSPIQIEYGSERVIVLNIQPFRSPEQLEQYDDEIIFKSHFRECLSQWSGQSYKEIKQCMKKKTMNTVSFLKDHVKGQTISFPQNWKHYLLYSYVIEERLNKGMLDRYTIFKYSTANIGLFSKQMYLRAYRLDEEHRIKNIKSAAGICQKYSIAFFQNGERLYMVMNSSVEAIKLIFGYYQTVSSIGNHVQELPVLTTNEEYRQAIDLIRGVNEQKFLPLKIIDYDSYLYSELVEPFLYQRDQHMAFLRKMWRYS